MAASKLEGGSGNGGGFGPYNGSGGTRYAPALNGSYAGPLPTQTAQQTGTQAATIAADAAAAASPLGGIVVFGLGLLIGMVMGRRR